MNFFLQIFRFFLFFIALFEMVFLCAFVWKNWKNEKVPMVSSSREHVTVTFPSGNGLCRFPLRYSIGFIDPNFHLSKEEFSKALQEAEAVWETGLGKDFFTMDERSGVLSVNLIFDRRQERTDSLKEVSSDISTRESAYENLRADYETLRKSFDRQKAEYDENLRQYEKNASQYETRVQKYNDRLDSYDKLVAEWNAKGGAPPDEYEELQDERDDLKKKASSLEEERDDLGDERKALSKDSSVLNTLSGKINTLAGNLNRMARDLNLTVDTYHQVFGERKEFTTGLYVFDESGRHIDVFQFYDYGDLVFILAHEMGHALGVKHATDSNSLMYPSIDKQKPVLSDEDRKLFESACGN